MDTTPRPKNPSRLPIVLLVAAFLLAVAGAAVLARQEHRLKFQLGLANAGLAAAKSDLAAAHSQITQIQARLDAATAENARWQAQMQQLVRLFSQSRRQFGKSNRLPIYAGFSRVPSPPGTAAPPAFKLRVRTMLPGQLKITVKSSSSGREKTTAFTIGRFWTDPDTFAPGDKIEISTEGYPPVRLQAPPIPPPAPASPAKQ
jgi:hypothetical protein